MKGRKMISNSKSSPHIQVMPGQGRGHAMMASTIYNSEEDTSGSFRSQGLTGAVMHGGGRTYEMFHSGGGGGGLCFSRKGTVKVMIDNEWQVFTRQDITEHRKDGYYSVRRGGRKYNIKYNQFEVDSDPEPEMPQIIPQQVMPLTTTTTVTNTSTSPIINFFPYYRVKMGRKMVTVPYSMLAGGRLKGKFVKFSYNGTTQKVRCRNVQPVRSMYKCIINGNMVTVPYTDISAGDGDGMYNITYGGATYTVSTASVHAGDVMPGHDGRYDHKILFVRPRRNRLRLSQTGGGGNLRLKSKKPRRRVDQLPKLEIFDVSYCLCYLIILNGSQIVMPHHRIKASVKHRGYLRFRYNKLVYYVTPQTVQQAFYAPVVGYYACLLGNKLVVVSGMDIERDRQSPEDNMYIIRYEGMEYHAPAPNITFLGEFLLEPDRDGPGGDDDGHGGDGSDSSTSDSDASVAGRDEVIRDAEEYITTTTIIRRKRITRVKRVKINGVEVTVPDDQITMCRNPRGYAKVTYYGKTYFVPVSDIEEGGDTDVVGFYSVNLDGLPFIITGMDIKDHPRRPGFHIVRFNDLRYLVPKHGVLYLGDYPSEYAPDYCTADFGSEDEFWMEGGDETDHDSSIAPEDVGLMFSDDEPQECIFVRGDDPDMPTDMPETLVATIQPGQTSSGKSVMGYRVTINGQEYTVPAGKCRMDPSKPGFIEVTINGRRHLVHMNSVKPMSVPIVYFVNIDDDIQVIPARYLRRDPLDPNYVLVTFKGREYRIPLSYVNLMDGRRMSVEDVPDENAPCYGGCISVMPLEKNWIIPEGAPHGGYFEPDGTYIGPDGRPYGKGKLAPYRIPVGAPPGGYFGPDGLYYGPDGQCYGPGIPYGLDDFAAMSTGGDRQVVDLPSKCSRFCILHGGHRMRVRRRRYGFHSGGSDSDDSHSSSSSSSKSSSHRGGRGSEGSHGHGYPHGGYTQEIVQQNVGDVSGSYEEVVQTTTTVTHGSHHGSQHGSHHGSPSGSHHGSPHGQEVMMMGGGQVEIQQGPMGGGQVQMGGGQVHMGGGQVHMVGQSPMGGGQVQMGGGQMHMGGGQVQMGGGQVHMGGGQVQMGGHGGQTQMQMGGLGGGMKHGGSKRSSRRH